MKQKKMKNMPIDFLFPYTYHLVSQKTGGYQKAWKKYQKYDDKKQYFELLCVVILLLFGLDIGCFMYLLLQGNLHLDFSFFSIFFLLLLILVAGMLETDVSDAKEEFEAKINNSFNHFSIYQTCFYIKLDNEKALNLFESLTSKNLHSQTLDLSDYKVYANIYNELSSDTTRYFVGQMKNGKLIAVDNYDSDYKPFTRSMIATINDYALYIKEHHLESKFANSATLRFSTKYLDKNYKPMLVMKNKNGATLHLKQNSNINVKNVVFTN